MEGGDVAHVLLLPYPSQGHINPLLQFGKRLASHGLRATLAATRYIFSSTDPEPGPVAVVPISDGCDEGGFAQAGSVEAYLDRLESAGSQSLADLIESQHVDLLVYDAFFPWALDVAKRLGVAAAAFFTQSCAVDAVYCHAFQGRLPVPVPVTAAGVSLPGLPRLELRDLPAYLTDLDPVPYPAYKALLLSQFRNLEKADLVLINSFYELEPEEVDWIESILPVKAIGPAVPSAYLDNRLPANSHYGFHLYAPDTEPCLTWLDNKPPSSVVYVSFGSMASLGQEQMEELAYALKKTNSNFLWVVRASEASKIPEDFVRETSEQGLVVTWSPQLEVLAHQAVGCFMTHCGWNSTLEGISLGVPMVGVPQWTDQLMNAKYVEDVWGVGVRATADGKGVVRREEMERCIREVMGGGRSEEMRRNARKWRETAKAAVSEGGSSDRNIMEFIRKYCS